MSSNLEPTDLEDEINKNPPTNPYSRILKKYKEHEGTLGGLLTALDKFRGSKQVQDGDKKKVDEYIKQIKAIRQKSFDDTWQKLDVPKAYMTREDFDNMHKKLMLRVKTNVMRNYVEVKPHLEIGDQLWMLRKGIFHRSYAHVAIVSQTGGNVKFIHVGAPNFRVKSKIKEDDEKKVLSEKNEEEIAYFIVKPPVTDPAVDRSIYQKRAKACIGICFDYDHKTNCEYFGNAIHGEWIDANVMEAAGAAQKGGKAFGKVSNYGLMMNAPLCDQMKEKIEAKKGLILSFENF